jgi:hypothetical protein
MRSLLAISVARTLVRCVPFALCLARPLVAQVRDDTGPYITIGGGQATISSPADAYGPNRIDGTWMAGVGVIGSTGLGLEARTFAVGAEFTSAVVLNGERAVIGMSSRLYEVMGSARPSRLKFRGVQAFLTVGAVVARVTDFLETDTPRESFSGTRIGGVGAAGAEVNVIGGVNLTARVSYRNVGSGGSRLPLPATLDGLGWDAGIRLALW